MRLVLKVGPLAYDGHRAPLDKIGANGLKTACAPHPHNPASASPFG